MFQRGRAAWALTAIAALVLGWIVVDALFQVAPRVDLIDDEIEPFADRREARRKAFAADATPIDDPQLAAFFEGLGRAAGNRDALRGLECFDVSRLSTLVAPSRETEALPALVKAVWLAVETGFIGDGWTTTRILHVDTLAGGAERIVVVRHLTTSGEALPFVWRLRNEGEEVRACDLEDARSGVLLSRQLRDGFDADRAPETQDRLRRGAVAWQTALAEPRPSEALKALEPARLAPWPAEQRLQFLLFEANLAVAADDRPRVHAALSATKLLRPQLPARDRLYAALALREGNPTEAEAFALKYLAELGPDTQVCLVLAKAMVGSGRANEAIQMLSAAKRTLPNSKRIDEELRALTMMP